MARGKEHSRQGSCREMGESGEGKARGTSVRFLLDTEKEYL